MGRPLQTIYEYFYDYSEDQINQVISNLPLEDRIIIRDRYGFDLHNPNTLKTFNEEKLKKFYKKIIPNIRKTLYELNNKKNVVNETNPFGKTFIEPIGLPLKVLELIKKGKNNNEICSELNLSMPELANLLLSFKNNGLVLSKKYYSNGTIKYKTVNNTSDLIDLNTNSQERTIITDVNEDYLNFLVISDLHFGNELQRLDLIDRAFNYCSKKGINIILSCGDLIDGSYTKGNQIIPDLYQQLEFFIKNYPHDKNILTFSVGGDHDMCPLKEQSLDMVRIFDNYRPDVIMCGYNNVSINLKNDCVDLYHLTYDKIRRPLNSPIALHGHAHKYLTNMREKALFVSVPSLSNIVQPMPSALELHLFFKKGYISSCIIKNVYFGTEDIILSDATFQFNRDFGKLNGPISNEENYRDDYLKEPKTFINRFN